MRTPAEVIVEAGFRLYPDDQAALKKYISERVQRYLETRYSDLGQSDVESVLFFVCDVTSANPSTIGSPLRSREVIEARAIMYFICRRMLKWSLKATGHAFGGRDHSTIISGLKNYDDWIESDRVFRAKAEKSLNFAHKTFFDDDTKE
jgi:chromosomal replication initiation ATPase DnaA